MYWAQREYDGTIPQKRTEEEDSQFQNTQPSAMN